MSKKWRTESLPIKACSVGVEKGNKATLNNNTSCSQAWGGGEGKGVGPRPLIRVVIIKIKSAHDCSRLL